MGRKRNEKRNRTPRAATASMPARQTHVAVATALVALLAILPFLNALSNGFALDDEAIVVKNPLIRDLANVGRMFSTDYWTGSEIGLSPGDHGLYRPLTVLTYAVNYALSGLSAPAFH